MRKVIGSSPISSTKKSVTPCGVADFFRGGRTRTGRRSAERKKRAGGTFFSPRKSSYIVHQLLGLKSRDFRPIFCFWPFLMSKSSAFFGRKFFCLDFALNIFFCAVKIMDELVHSGFALPLHSVRHVRVDLQSEGRRIILSNALLKSGQIAIPVLRRVYATALPEFRFFSFWKRRRSVSFPNSPVALPLLSPLSSLLHKSA